MNETSVMNETINKINSQVINNDNFLLYDVVLDNVTDKLNEKFNGNWSYNVNIIQKSNESIYIKVLLFFPKKFICGFARTSEQDMNNGIKKAIYNAVQIGFKIIKNKPSYNTRQNKQDINTVLTTLDDLDKLENEIGMQKPKRTNIETKNEPKQNRFNIRQDQIDFMNAFQNKYKITSEQKFNSYIDKWTENKNSNIKTKQQLVLAGADAIDDFISWVKQMSKDKIAVDDFVCPSEEEIYECCKD